MSGNTFGARYWTDGKREAPMLPEQLDLVKCPHCGTSLWVSELKELGMVSPWDMSETDKDAFTDALEVITPSFNDYFNLLKESSADSSRHRYLRIYAWWAGNDKRRQNQEPSPLDPQEIKNHLSLLSLLDESDENDRIMKAEVYRELGKFTEAEKLLLTSFQEGLKRAVAIIRDLNAKKLCQVEEMKFE